MLETIPYKSKEEELYSNLYANLPAEFREPAVMFFRINSANKYFHQLSEAMSAQGKGIVDSAYKLSVLQSIQGDIYRLKGDKDDSKKLAEIRASIQDLMNHLEIQYHAYNMTAGILENHLPKVYKTIRLVSSSKNPQQTQLYLGLQQYKSYISHIGEGQIFNLQGVKDNSDVCAKSSIADDVQSRFHDEQLANSLRSMPTGYGKKGKARILKIIDHRIKELKGSLGEDIGQYHAELQNSISQVERLRKMYTGARAALSEQYECYRLIGQSGLTPQSLSRLISAVEDESKYESGIMGYVDANFPIINMQIERMGRINRTLRRMEVGSETSYEWYLRNKDTIDATFTLVALIGAIFTGQAGFLYLSAPAVLRVTKGVNAIKKVDTLRSKIELFGGTGKGIFNFFRSGIRKKKLAKKKIRRSKEFWQTSLELLQSAPPYIEKWALRAKSLGPKWTPAPALRLTKR